jgi:hypothetical protein
MRPQIDKERGDTAARRSAYISGAHLELADGGEGGGVALGIELRKQRGKVSLHAMQHGRK